MSPLEKTMKTYYLEIKDCKGHVSLYRDILCNDNSDYELVTSQEFAHSLKLNPSVKTKFLWRKIRLNGKITNRIEQIYLTLKALNYIGNKGRIIFLSYDTIVLTIALLIKRSYFSISAFEHNNIDQCEVSFIKRICYRFLSTKIKSLVFERYIGEYIRDEYNRKFEVVQHIKLKFHESNFSSSLKDYIFIPSGQVSEKAFNKILNFARGEGLSIICKDYPFLAENSYEDVKTSKYFEDYEKLMFNANYVAIPNEFRYRISGVFYEAIGNEKQVVMTDSLFSREMAKIYNNTKVVY